MKVFEWYKLESGKCVICNRFAQWVLHPGRTRWCYRCRIKIDKNQIVDMPIEMLEFNKTRNTIERMLRKVTGVSLTEKVCESIRKYGLINPLVIEPRSHGKFGVLLGSNRLASILFLVREGRQWEKVQCVVVHDDTVDVLKKIRGSYEKVAL
jgi:hypothetical protein